MSQENVGVVRQEVSLPERPSRTLEQRLALRFPRFLELWLRLTARLSPTSRLRQALWLRAVQGGADAYNRGDLAVVVLGYHANVEFQFPPGSEEGALGFRPSYSGPAGYRAFEADWGSGWAALRFEPSELIDLDDRLLLIGQLVGHGEGSGISVGQKIAVVWTLGKDGKIVREQRYLDHAEALEAVGLSE
jgi:ketosteroid isomerase-like protein